MAHEVFARKAAYYRWEFKLEVRYLLDNDGDLCNVEGTERIYAVKAVVQDYAVITIEDVNGGRAIPYEGDCCGDG